jgi:carboxymethylenebutenolidase
LEEDTTVRRTVGLFLAVLVLAAAMAPAGGAEVKTNEVTFKSGKDDVKGFLAVPDGPGPFPAVVVIQEWWGLNDWVKDQAKRLAAQGYIALAPDLYRGKVTADPKTAFKLMSGLPRDRAMRDLKGAVDFLAKHDKAQKDKIGSIGWCMGGGYSLQLALADKRVTACVMCYGRVVTEADDLKPLNATVLGVFGKEDRNPTIDDVRKFGAALKEAGKKTAGLGEYEAGHGFMRPNNGPDPNPAYREGEAKKAWAAIDKFFAKTLKGK